MTRQFELQNGITSKLVSACASPLLPTASMTAKTTMDVELHGRVSCRETEYRATVPGIRFPTQWKREERAVTAFIQALGMITCITP